MRLSARAISLMDFRDLDAPKRVQHVVQAESTSGARLRPGLGTNEFSIRPSSCPIQLPSLSFSIVPSNKCHSTHLCI